MTGYAVPAGVRLTNHRNAALAAGDVDPLSHNMKAQSISLRSSSGPAREPGHETDLVATIMEFLVVNGRVIGGV